MEHYYCFDCVNDNNDDISTSTNEILSVLLDEFAPECRTNLHLLHYAPNGFILPDSKYVNYHLIH